MTLPALLTIWTVSLLLALVALAVLIRSLRILLTDMCGATERARFWTLYAALLMVLAPLLTVSVPGLLESSAVLGIAPLLQRTVFYALVGIIAALVIMGYAVWRPIAHRTAAPTGRK